VALWPAPHRLDRIQLEQALRALTCGAEAARLAGRDIDGRETTGRRADTQRNGAVEKRR